MSTVLVLGLGEVGAHALELLARSPGVDRIIAAQRDVAAGEHRTQVAAVGATFQGFAKQIAFHRIDVADVDGTARLLSDLRPDVILSSVTVQSPRKLMTANIDPVVRTRLSMAGFSMWLAWQLLPVSQLMAAVLKSGIDTRIVNAAFPDVVNPAIWRHFGTGPVLGLGNIEMLAAGLARQACSRHGASLGAVSVTLIASHAYLLPAARAYLPAYLRVTVKGEDVTAELDTDAALDVCPGVSWARTTFFSGFAASAAKNVLGLLRSDPVRTTVTAPNGLPGGYPAEVSVDGVRIDLPAGLGLNDAVAINEAGNRFDGIDRVAADGAVHYTDAAAEAMQELGYDCASLHFSDLQRRADELRELYRRLASGPAGV